MTDVRPKPVCITALKQKLGESVLTIEKLETLIKETGPSNVSFFLSPMALAHACQFRVINLTSLF